MCPGLKHFVSAVLVAVARVFAEAATSLYDTSVNDTRKTQFAPNIGTARTEVKNSHISDSGILNNKIFEVCTVILDSTQCTGC